VRARRSLLIGQVAHRAEYFGRDHHFIACLSDIFERAAQNHFGGAMRVRVRGIDEIDTRIERLSDHRISGALFDTAHDFELPARAKRHRS